MSDPDEQLRHLLRGLAVTEPMPDDVDARLEQTLVRLAASRRERPRRSFGRILGVGAVAASAVGVVAFGVATLAHSPLGTSGSTSMAASADSLAGSQQQTDTMVRSSSESEAVPSATTQSMSPGAVKAPEGAVPMFSSDGLTAQLQSWWAGSPSIVASRTCPGPWLSGPAQPLPALLDGSQAALLVYPPQGSSQLLELYRCDSPDQAAASVTVTAP